MSRSIKGVIGVIVVVVIAAILFAVFHKSSSPSTNNSPGTTSQTANTPATNNSIVLTKTDPQLGKILTDPSGKPLYFFNGDSTNKSNCTGSCLSNWPAYTAKASTASLPSGITTLTRSDNGQVQYVYNGHPLYFFTGDSGTQVTGNGVQNFSVAMPSSAAASQPSSSSTQPASSSGSGYPY